MTRAPGRPISWTRIGPAALLIALLGCKGPRPEPGATPSPPPPPRALAGTSASPPPGAAWFTDVTREAGLDGFRQVNGDAKKLKIVEAVGGGVAFLDYDRDGHLDVYLGNGSSLQGFPPGKEPRDALYRNDGHGRFRDVTVEAHLGDAGWTTGVLVGDPDNDGWPDLFLANLGANALHRNRGDGTFEDVTLRAGLGDDRWSTAACWLDADRDGDLDLYVANYVAFDPGFVAEDTSTCRYREVMVAYGPRGLEGSADAFYRNQGGLRFADATGEAGIADPLAYGFQPVAFDADDDGDVDVFVANDSVPNFLWKNLGDGRFVEAAAKAGLARNHDGKAQASMGVATGDVDGDGLLDLVVTTFSDDHDALFRADGKGFYSEVARSAGLVEPTWSSLGWGAGLHDFDLDGDLDLFVANGHVYPQVDQADVGTRYRQRNLYLENQGQGRFKDRSADAGPGLRIEKAHRGAAFADFDDDGDIDVLVGSLDDAPTLLRNDLASDGGALLVRLVGTRSNRDAVGARVSLVAGGRTQVRHVVSGASFASSSDLRLHFGLGGARRIERIEVRWPMGGVETFTDVAPGATVTIEEGKGTVLREPLKAAA